VVPKAARTREAVAMARTADVVVVGGGVNGLSVAYHLAKRGAGRVCLVERSHLAAGATGKSGALVRTHYTNEPETLLALRSLEVFEHWDDVIGGDCGFAQVGMLIFAAARDREAFGRNVAMHRRLGVDSRLVSVPEALALDPGLHLTDVGAIAYEPRSGYADPNLTAYAFARAAADRGVELLLETAATAIEVHADRVAGVRTSQGTIAAGTVVVCAGAGAGPLLVPLGIDLGLRPCRARVVLFRPAYERPSLPLTYIDHVRGTWYRPDGNRTLVGAEVGVERDTDPDTTPEHVEQGYIAHCHREMVGRFPAMRHSTTRGNWSGVITMSPDARPLIGALPYAGLYCVAGDSGTSFKTSPAIGQSVSELVVDGTSRIVDLTPFRPARVAEGALWVDPDDYDVDSPTISR